MTVSAQLLAHAAFRPDAVAIEPIVGPTMTYGNLADTVEARAQALVDADLAALPDPVVLEGDYCADMVVMELALLAAGIPVLSLPAAFSENERQNVISDCRARQIGHRTHVPQHRSTCRFPAGTARITYASGASGTPEVIAFDGDHLVMVARNVVAALGDHAAGRHLAVLPPGTLLEAVCGMFATLLAGGTYVCPPQALIGMADPLHPECQVLAAFVAQHRITTLILVPELLMQLVAAIETTEVDCPDLSIVAVVGGRVPPAVFARARQLGLPVRQGYGVPKAGSIVALEAAEGDPLGAVGRVLPHLRARLAPDGEILLDSLQGISSHASWPLHTGDLGHIDQAGRLWIDGRKPGVIATSHGHTVATRWLEERLLAQPGVAQAMVYGDGMPLPRALLVPASPLADLDAAVASVNAELPAYARIDIWQEVSPFARTSARTADGDRLDRHAISAQWLDAEPSFFTRLEAATVRQRLAFLALAHMHAGLSGTISRATYLAYLGQAHHHLRHVMAAVRMIRVRLAHRPMLVAALDAYEANQASCKAAIFNAVVGAGGHTALAFEPEHHSAAGLMIEHALRETGERNPLAIAGMAYAMECVGMGLVQHGASALATNRDPPPDALLCLAAIHARDRKSIHLFEALVNDITDPEDQTAVLAMARTAFGLMGVMFTAISLESRHDDSRERGRRLAKGYR